MMTANIKKVERKSVNSESMANFVRENVEAVILTLGPRLSRKSDRDAIISSIEEEIFENHLYNHEEVTQYRVTCQPLQEDGSVGTGDGLTTYILSVAYKQRHCVNTTRINFHITLSNKTSHNKDEHVI